jgi:quercetin dioxygenase-like cupin family protein
MIVLEPGNSWVVPKGATHSYKVLEDFTAIEATYPPYQVHGRDQNPVKAGAGPSFAAPTGRERNP